MELTARMRDHNNLVGVAVAAAVAGRRFVAVVDADGADGTAARRMWPVARRYRARCDDAPDGGCAAVAPPARCIPASPGPAPLPPNAGAACSSVPFPAPPSPPVLVRSWFRYREIAGDRPVLTPPIENAAVAAADEDAVAAAVADGDAADAGVEDNATCDRSRRRHRLRRPLRHHSRRRRRYWCPEVDHPRLENDRAIRHWIPDKDARENARDVRKLLLFSCDELRSRS